MPWSLACVRLFRILVVADLLLLSGVSAADAEARVPGRHGARIIAEESAGERLVDLTVSSPALGGTARVRLLTPVGWERRRPGERWPVVYLLHGGLEPETYRTWIRESDVEELPQLWDYTRVTDGWAAPAPSRTSVPFVGTAS
ncbi:hypothetical protein OHA02_01060 [Streptomyces phaeochromogenes]|nr:hypothetical protein [Streptomyces phaeochromogenes]